MLAPDTILQGRYRVIKAIGQGGMGAVYEAEDQRLAMTVALKETFFSADKRLAKAFEHEARLLACLKHAALPRVTDHFIDEHGQFLAMEFINGQDLMELLENRKTPFSPSEVLGWADQLLDVLGYLHSHEPPIIHRDIKPQNLKLTTKGSIILLDFGLAKGTPAHYETVSSKGSILGYTPSYAPFEQIRGAGTDPRSDLYAAAATFYHLATGVKPPDALHRAGEMVSGSGDPLRPLNELNPNYSAAVAAVFQKAMRINREERPKTAAEMARDLRSAGLEVETVNPGAGTIIISGPESADKSSYATVVDPKTPTAGPSSYATVVGVDEFGQATELQANSANGERTKPSLGSTTGDITQAPAYRPKSHFAVAATVAIAVLALIAVVGIVYLRQNPGHSPASPTAAIATPAVDLAVPDKPVTTSDTAGLTSFTFNVLTVSDSSTFMKEETKQARFFGEELGAGAALDMVEIPGGSFLMGSPVDEVSRRSGEDQHKVTVPSFFLGKYEVSQAQWRAVAVWPKVQRDLNPSPAHFKGDRLPVEGVSWEDAREFCARLTKRTGRNYRLPTESEWEYACRAGTKTPFHFGGTLSASVANYDARQPYRSAPKESTREKTTEVGSFGRANNFGLFDMHGNVWEWCLDPWHDGYQGAPADSNSWEDGGDQRYHVTRGGSWFDPAESNRSAFRRAGETGYSSSRMGFRVAMQK